MVEHDEERTVGVSLKVLAPWSSRVAFKPALGLVEARGDRQASRFDTVASGEHSNFGYTTFRASRQNTILQLSH